MRIGLLADLHANRPAMETCMAALEDLGCSHWVFLGDLVGYGGDPGWVIDRVRERVAEGAVAVLGNHDQAVVTELPDTMSTDTRAAILWTREQLDASQWEFLRGLPLQVEEDDRLYVHANAWEPSRWGYVSNRLAAAQSLAATSQWLTFCGHVHEPALYFQRAPSASHFEPRAGTPIPLSTQRRWLAIPGSCGQPRDSNPAAACAWFEPSTRQLTFLRLPYDHDRAARTIMSAALPSAFAARLLNGV
jgi:diadenosine tetraphosphatase ApaH/serine/threonine PP2A family protein phosphatase